MKFKKYVKEDFVNPDAQDTYVKDEIDAFYAPVKKLIDEGKYDEARAELDALEKDLNEFEKENAKKKIFKFLKFMIDGQRKQLAALRAKLPTNESLSDMDRRCEKCNTLLNDGGTCPKCDDGEEDYGDERGDDAEDKPSLKESITVDAATWTSLKQFVDNPETTGLDFVYDGPYSDLVQELYGEAVEAYNEENDDPVEPSASVQAGRGSSELYNDNGGFASMDFETECDEILEGARESDSVEDFKDFLLGHVYDFASMMTYESDEDLEDEDSEDEDLDEELKGSHENITYLANAFKKALDKTDFEFKIKMKDGYKINITSTMFNKIKDFANKFFKKFNLVVDIEEDNGSYNLMLKPLKTQAQESLTEETLDIEQKLINAFPDVDWNFKDSASSPVTESLTEELTPEEKLIQAYPDVAWSFKDEAVTEAIDPENSWYDDDYDDFDDVEEDRRHAALYGGDRTYCSCGKKLIRTDWGSYCPECDPETAEEEHDRVVYDDEDFNEGLLISMFGGKLNEEFVEESTCEWHAKECSYDIAHNIAIKACKELGLSRYECEDLEHDINNLRSNEWVDSFQDLPDSSPVKKLFFKYAVECIED